MCIRDRLRFEYDREADILHIDKCTPYAEQVSEELGDEVVAVSYTHLRAHETVLDLVCRLLLEKKKNESNNQLIR